jgi:hypothetical protein
MIRTKNDPVKNYSPPGKKCLSEKFSREESSGRRIFRPREKKKLQRRIIRRKIIRAKNFPAKSYLAKNYPSDE